MPSAGNFLFLTLTKLKQLGNLVPTPMKERMNGKDNLPHSVDAPNICRQ